jgi:hypothetical protein
VHFCTSLRYQTLSSMLVVLQWWKRETVIPKKKTLNKMCLFCMLGWLVLMNLTFANCGDSSSKLNIVSEPIPRYPKPTLHWLPDSKKYLCWLCQKLIV